MLPRDDIENGIIVEVRPEEFKKKTLKEQNLTIYQAITYVNRHGSHWARKNSVKLLIVIGVVGTVLLSHIGIKEAGSLLTILVKLLGG